MGTTEVEPVPYALSASSWRHQLDGVRVTLALSLLSLTLYFIEASYVHV